VPPRGRSVSPAGIGAPVAIGRTVAAKCPMLKLRRADRAGPGFDRLREETGCRAVTTEPARAHWLERAAFLDVLHRLFVSGSDRSANRWRDDLCDCRRRGASALCCCGPRRHEGGAEIVISGMRAQH